MINCEKDCPHRSYNVIPKTKRELLLCESCLTNQLRAAEAENERLRQQNKLLLEYVCPYRDSSSDNCWEDSQQDDDMYINTDIRSWREAMEVRDD